MTPNRFRILSDKLAEIELTQGQWTLVDLEDLRLLLTFRWNAQLSRTTWYARTMFYDKATYIHDVLIPHRSRKSTVVDHINRNGLDNRKSNLRVVPKSLNNLNAGPRVDNTTGMRGVDFRTDTGKWRAQINIDGRRVNLGSFDSAEEAQKVYEAARSKRLDTVH